MSEREVISGNLSDIQKEIADIIGIDEYIKLMQYVNGHSIYIPKYSDMLKPNRNQEIIDSFNGYNFKELALKHDLSVKSIYNIIPPEVRKEKRRQASNVDGQMRF